MSPTTEETTRSVEEVASKLRMAQIGFADDPADQREKYMLEVVDEVLRRVLPDQKAEFLTRLEDKFPVWSSALPGDPVRASRPAQNESWETLAELLIERAGMMEEEEKKRLVSQLQAGGLAVTEAPSAHEAASLPRHIAQASQYLMQQAGIASLDFVRTMKLVVLLFFFASTADAVVWRLWKVLSPKSDIKHPCDLKQAMARYISGDKEISGVDLKRDLDLLQNLMMWLFAALGKAGTEMAQGHLMKFMPHVIQTEVNKDGGSPLFGQEVKCWKRYCEIANELEEDVIDYALREAIARRVEAFAKTQKE